MWQHVCSISCSQAFFTTDILTHCRKSTGDTNNINDGSVIFKCPRKPICTTPGSWNWSSYMEFNHRYSLLFTPVLVLLRHVKMSAVIKACWVVAWMCSSWVWSCRKTCCVILKYFASHLRGFVGRTERKPLQGFIPSWAAPVLQMLDITWPGWLAPVPYYILTMSQQVFSYVVSSMQYTKGV